MSKPDPKFTLTGLCDLLKAFDVINHDILLKKMKSYGILGIAHDWFENYLSDCQKFVEVGGKISDKVPITIGVPQGSIIGPDSLRTCNHIYLMVLRYGLRQNKTLLNH